VRRVLRWILLLVVVIAAAGGGWYWYETREPGVPAGFVLTNGRIEATRIDIATKYAGRLSEVNVREGDVVEAGQVLARLDSTELEAQIREAEASSRQARERLKEAQAILEERRADEELARRQLDRATTLARDGHVSQETVDQRRSQARISEAAVGSAEAQIAQATAAVDVADAVAERLKVQLADYALRAPRNGRVQYRLAEPGEVLPVGGKVLSLLDLSDVYMTVFLPTDDAGRLAFGGEARLIFDAAPQYVVPATVTFVASEAQFTPKYVETASEREKLTFRVKLTIPPEILQRYQEIVKTGVPGVAYVRLDSQTPWPDRLAVKLPQ